MRVLQEALTNLRRHSGARNVLVSLRTEGDDLIAEVTTTVGVRGEGACLGLV